MNKIKKNTVDYVRGSVRRNVGDYLWTPVWNSIWNRAVGNYVRGSVGDSVWAGVDDIINKLKGL